MKQNIPTSIVIFGGTGDLSRKMLVPALQDLESHSYLHNDSRIYIFAHTDLDTKSIREKLRPHLKKSEHTEAFLQKVTYVRGSFDQYEDYSHLKEVIDTDDGDICSNKLFYFSVSPRFFKHVASGIAHAGLDVHCYKGKGWVRAVIEKPFGHDLESSKEYDADISSVFSQKQIYHVDHYLCKDMVRNMIAFRFSNSIFEPLWNNTYIEKIEIVMHEDIDVSTRGKFFDPVGAYKDVGQNHMLSMLAFLTMDRPKSLTATDMQRARQVVLEELVLREEGGVRMQYEGYRETVGVADDSETETYFKLKAEIESERWRGVPITLSSGKAMKKKDSYMRVTFKDTPCLCNKKDAEHTHENILTFRLKPEESIELGTWTKIPGINDDLTEKVLRVPYVDETHQGVRGAYSKVFHDAIAGDQTLFKSIDEIYASWVFSDKVAQYLGSLPLTFYTPGH